MKISVQKVFKWLLFVFVGFLTCYIAFALVEAYLPPNKITHECKPPYDTARLFTVDYEQGFCQQYYHAEFNDSWKFWGRAINNVAVPGFLLSGMLLIPPSLILIIRRFTPKK